VVVSAVVDGLEQAKGGVVSALVMILTGWRIEIGALACAINANAGGFIAVVMISTGAMIIPASLPSIACPTEHLMNAIGFVENTYNVLMRSAGNEGAVTW
jgi:hypothetical protein